MMWPPQELRAALAKLRTFAENLEFADFRFSAVVFDGTQLALRCDWREVHSFVPVPPTAFEDERLLWLVARNAIARVVNESMDHGMRLAAPRTHI